MRADLLQISPAEKTKDQTDHRTLVSHHATTINTRQTNNFIS